MTNVHIKDVVLDNHLRQGMSVCSGVVNLTVENVVMSNTGGHAPACGLDIEFDHNTAITQNVTFRNISFINNTNCGISVSANAMAADPAHKNWDHPNRLEITFDDIFVDNRGQGLMSGDDMAGIQITNIPPVPSCLQEYGQLSRYHSLVYNIM